jgi:hypothetical protein
MADCPFAMLNKPYRRDELAQAVRDLLDGDVLEGDVLDGDVSDGDAGPATTGITRQPAWTHRGARVGRGAAMAEPV